MRSTKAREAEAVAAGAAHVERAAAADRRRNAVGRAHLRVYRQAPPAAGFGTPAQHCQLRLEASLIDHLFNLACSGLPKLTSITKIQAGMQRGSLLELVLD